MTDQDIKMIFSRFENLNLLTLIEDIKISNVAWRGWMKGGALCPLAHGWCRNPGIRFTLVDAMSCAGLGGTDVELGGKFYSWYDDWGAANPSYHDLKVRTGFLLDVLAGIWQERLADANAVQQITGEPSHALALLDFDEQDNAHFRNARLTADVGGEA